MAEKDTAMEFASYLSDWPAYVLVFIAVIAAAFSLNRLSWPLVVGTFAILAAFAIADAFPSIDSRITEAALFCAIAATYAVRRRFWVMLAILLVAVGYTVKSFVPHNYQLAIMIATMAVAGGVSELQSRAK